MNIMHTVASEFLLNILQTVHSSKSKISLSKLKKLALTGRLMTRLSLSLARLSTLISKRRTITIPPKQDVSSLIPSTHSYTGQDVTSRTAKSTPTGAMSVNLHHGHKFIYTAGSMDTRLSIAMHTTR